MLIPLLVPLGGCDGLHVNLGQPGGPAAAAPGAVNGQVKVQTGDTVYAISRRTSVPVRELIDANPQLTPPYFLKPGDTLNLPQARRHVVRPNDTVYSIADQYGIDVSTLTRQNNLKPPYTLRVGQSLVLPATVEAARTPPPARPAPLIEAPVDRGGKPGAAPPPESAGNAPPANNAGANLPTPPPEKPEIASTELPTATAPASQDSPLAAPPPRGGNFLWPVKGKILARYGTNASGTRNEGINIEAPRGTPVHAADAGVVAYAGNEMRGYGNLILVKHAGGWMTAYAHNDLVMVKRGDTVKRGQEIATVGSTGLNGDPQLHFEIRRGVKALDPSEYLPGSQASAVP